MKHYHSLKSLNDFSDRDLLLFILSNQIKIYRQTEYLMSQVKIGKIEGLGAFSHTFHDMLGSMDDVIKQSEEYLKKMMEIKGF